MIASGWIVPIGNLPAQDSLKTHFRVIAALSEPFITKKDQKIVGFDKDLFDLICTINNWTYDLTLVPASKITSLLQQDSADIALGSIYREHDSIRKLYSSIGYLKTGLTIVSPITQPIHSVEEFQGLRVGVNMDGTGFWIAKNLLQNEGKRFVLVPYFTTEEVFRALSHREVDVILNGYYNSYFITITDYTGQFYVSDELVEQYELGFPVSTSFKLNLAKMNDDITSLKSSGLISDLQKKWLIKVPKLEFRMNSIEGILILSGIVVFIALLFWAVKKYTASVESRKYLREKILLSRALEYTGDIIIITDRNHQIKYINPEGKAFLNRDHSELIGKENQFFYYSNITIDDKQQLEESIQKNLSWRKNLTLQSLEGQRTIYDVKVSPFTDNLFSDLIIILASDITKIVSIESEMSLLADRYQSLVRQSSDGIFIFDPKTLQIQEANAYFLEMTGFTEEDIHTMKTTDIVVDPTNSMLENVRQIAELGQHFTAERQYRKKDGSFVDVGVKASLIKYGNQSVVMVNVRDISERKKMIESLQSSEELYKKLINESPVGIVVTDEKGNITKVNKAVLSILGSPSEEATLKFNMLTLPALIKAGISQYYTEVLSNKQKVYIETDYTSVWGKTSKISFQIVPLFDESNNISGTLTIAEDINERKQKEEQLRESEEKYRSMFENMIEGFYQLDSDGKLITVNSALVAMLGYDTAEDVLGLNLEKDVYVNSAERAQVRQYAYQLNTKRYTEVFWRRKNGTQIIVSINERIVWDKNKNFKYFEATVIDISELKHAESERKSLEEQLIQSQKLESLGTLAGGIAHDFNNVLSMIMMSAETLNFMADDNSELKKYAELISSSAERGAGIAKQLLLFARSEKVELQPISLTHIINGVIELIRHSFPKTIEIKTDYHATNGIILGNSGHLQQVIMNLAINARDAMISSDRNFGTLTFRTKTLNNSDMPEKFSHLDYSKYVRLSIEDTGKGMSEEVIQRIFEPFFTTKSRGKGTGLGLSIVHGIMQSHHGLINVNSTIDVGTVFELYFPAVEQEEIVEEHDYSTLKSNLSETILIVDDEDLLRETMSEVLQNAGYQVIQAKHGIQALEIYRDQKDSISLIISDLGMPYMDGEELFNELKKITPDISVIISTGYLEKTSKEDMLKRGVKEIILKPYRIKDLLVVLRQVLDEKSNQQS